MKVRCCLFRESDLLERKGSERASGHRNRKLFQWSDVNRNHGAARPNTRARTNCAKYRAGHTQTLWKPCHEPATNSSRTYYGLTTDLLRRHPEPGKLLSRLPRVFARLSPAPRPCITSAHRHGNQGTPLRRRQAPIGRLPFRIGQQLLRGLHGGFEPPVLDLLRRAQFPTREIRRPAHHDLAVQPAEDQVPHLAPQFLNSGMEFHRRHAATYPRPGPFQLPTWMRHETSQTYEGELNPRLPRMARSRFLTANGCG